MADVNPVVDTNLGPAPTAPMNPIASAGGIVGVMSDLAEMRNRQNANLLFQQQMSARHQLGDDLAVWSAQGLSPTEQIAKARQQPYGVFVTPELANYQSSALAGAQTAKTQLESTEVQQRMAQAGLGTLGQVLASTGGDASKLPGAFNIATKVLPPALRGQLGPAFDAIKTSLTANLPSDPEAAKAELVRRTANLGTTLGVPIDKAYAAAGAVPLTAAIMPGGGTSVIGGLPGQAPPPMSVVQPPQAATSAGAASAPAPKALDGSPLFAPDSALPPQYKTNLTGTKTYPSALAESVASGAAKQWQADQPKYEAVAQSNATIGNMLDEVRTSAKNGGFLSPGFAGETRTMLGNAVNAAAAWFNPGKPPPFDPTKLAANEALTKSAKQLAFSLVSQGMGEGHQALGTLQTGLAAVPNVDKTPLGNIVVGEALHATGAWMLQKQEFERNWMARTGGDLTNASAEYLKEHPPAAVMSGVLAAHGLGPEGYTSRAAFLRDFHDGLLTSGTDAPLETAMTIAHHKGWITDAQFQAAKASGFKAAGGATAGGAGQ